MNIKKNHLKYGSIVLVLLVIGFFMYPRISVNENDDLAKCLTEKGTVFYGAFWCPHCSDQKEKFGSAMKHVQYVECSLPDRSGSTRICIDENIESYPTWEFPDGSRKTGVLSLEELASRSGCSI
jgi:large repetitive protein